MIKEAIMSAPIIITVPNNYLVDDVEATVVDLASPQATRKRRLDHLTWEEKMQRKKLKNRVAAQTSRDRKKAKMDEMESKINELINVNNRLVSEMENLKAINERLLSENTALRSKAAARTVAEAPGPAASHPRQKEGPPSAIPAARLMLALCLLSQTSSNNWSPKNTSTQPSLTSSLNPSSKRLVQLLQERLKMSQPGALQNALKQVKWWGPQQSNWNPVKVQS